MLHHLYAIPMDAGVSELQLWSLTIQVLLLIGQLAAVTFMQVRYGRTPASCEFIVTISDNPFGEPSAINTNADSEA